MVILRFAAAITGDSAILAAMDAVARCPNDRHAHASSEVEQHVVQSLYSWCAQTWHVGTLNPEP